MREAGTSPYKTTSRKGEPFRDVRDYPQCQRYQLARAGTCSSDSTALATAE